MIIVTTEQGYRVEDESYIAVDGEVLHEIDEDIWEAFQMAENQDGVQILNNHPEFLTIEYLE